MRGAPPGRPAQKRIQGKKRGGEGDEDSDSCGVDNVNAEGDEEEDTEVGGAETDSAVISVHPPAANPCSPQRLTLRRERDCFHACTV